MEMIPEHAELIRKCRNSMSVWIELHHIYEYTKPTASESLREKIMRFARWCVDQPGVPYSNDVYQAVTCAFIEHIVEDKRNWPLFRNFFDIEDIKALRHLWKYNFQDKADFFMEEICSVQPVAQQRTWQKKTAASVS